MAHQFSVDPGPVSCGLISGLVIRRRIDLLTISTFQFVMSRLEFVCFLYLLT